MSDGTKVNAGSGDTIRDIDRSLNSPSIASKTQVVQLDAGGQSNESLVSSSNPLPTRDPYTLLACSIEYQQLLVAQGQRSDGFIPFETPTFLF